MKEVLRFRRRWTPVGLAVGAVIVFSPMPYYLSGLLTDPRWKPTAETRIGLAALAVFYYWIFAFIANWRLAVVSPSGARTSMLPFPTGSGQRVRRDSILHCYARHHIETDDTDAYVVADYYAMGVETAQGHQVDIHWPYRTEADALGDARKVAQVLNRNSEARPIDVRLVQTHWTYPTMKRVLLLWTAITLLAMYLAWRWQ